MTVAISLPFWDDPSQVWNVLFLDGEAFPGIATVSGEVARDVEVKKTKGQDGATIKDNGYKPSTVEIVIRISTKEDWQELQLMLPAIHPRTKGGGRVPVTIEHPIPNLLGVNQIYIKRIGFPKLLDNKEIELPISAIEWLPEPKEVKKGAGGGAGGAGKGNADDIDEEERAQRELDESEYEEARRKWAEENGPFGDEWPMDDEDMLDFEEEYYDGADKDEDDESNRLDDDASGNAEDLAEMDDDGGWW